MEPNKDESKQVKQKLKQLYKTMWSRLDAIQKIFIIAFCCITVLAPVAGIIFCLTGQVDKEILPVSLGMAGILPFCLLFAREKARATVYGDSPQVWRYALAFLAYIAVIMGAVMIFSDIGKEPSLNGGGMVCILLGVVAFLPLAVFLLRGQKPSKKIKARWWQVLLLLVGVFLILEAGIFVILSIILKEKPENTTVFILLTIVFAVGGTASTLPFFLRKNKPETKGERQEAQQNLP